MDDDQALAEFQAALLDLMAEPLSADALMERLRNDPVFAEYRDYIDTFEPRMVEVAALLVKKWGVREGDTRRGSDGRA